MSGKPKGGDVLALVVNDNGGYMTKSGCSRRSIILLVVIVGLLLSSGTANGRETTRLTRTMEITLDDHAPGNVDNETESNLATVTHKHCREAGKAQMFPNLGYSLLGYNILKGYPLSVGHDPGFTLPIFAADYTPGLRTADCRYNVPTGLMINPDVSCEISFMSKVVKTQSQMSKALSVSANVGGGGWGVEFSASAEYKTSSSEMRSGEYVFIVSTATCGYFYNDLITMQPPPLHPMFSDWVKKLANADKKVYMDFFDTFGTHFAKRVTYGARYSYQYKMKWDTYERKEEMNVNVAVQASYSGEFSVSGGAGMTNDQKKQAEDFSKDVEWKLITTGAVPAATGGAKAWAAAVKENPLPISYDLDSIENLFTPAFMPDQDKKTIKKIADNIGKFKMDYCELLRMKGQVTSCAAIKPRIEMNHVRMHGHYGWAKGTYTECIQSCLDDSRCLAVTFCLKCPDGEFGHGGCWMYGTYEAREVSANENQAWNTVIFNEKIRITFLLVDTMIKGSPRGPRMSSDRGANQTECLALCLKDKRCTAFTHRPGNYMTSNCLLYEAEYIHGMAMSSGAVTKFVPWRQRAKALRDLEKSETNRTTMAFQQVG